MSDDARRRRDPDFANNSIGSQQQQLYHHFHPARAVILASQTFSRPRSSLDFKSRDQKAVSWARNSTTGGISQWPPCLATFFSLRPSYKYARQPAKAGGHLFTLSAQPTVDQAICLSVCSSASRRRHRVLMDKPNLTARCVSDRPLPSGRLSMKLSSGGGGGYLYAFRPAEAAVCNQSAFISTQSESQQQRLPRLIDELEQVWSCGPRR